jgi:protein-tyrosine phosphatase
MSGLLIPKQVILIVWNELYQHQRQQSEKEAALHAELRDGVVSSDDEQDQLITIDQAIEVREVPNGWLLTKTSTKTPPLTLTASAISEKQKINRSPRGDGLKEVVRTAWDALRKQQLQNREEEKDLRAELRDGLASSDEDQKNDPDSDKITIERDIELEVERTEEVVTPRSSLLPLHRTVTTTDMAAIPNKNKDGTNDTTTTVDRKSATPAPLGVEECEQVSMSTRTTSSMSTMTTSTKINESPSSDSLSSHSNAELSSTLSKNSKSKQNKKPMNTPKAPEATKTEKRPIMLNLMKPRDPFEEEEDEEEKDEEEAEEEEKEKEKEQKEKDEFNQLPMANLSSKEKSVLKSLKFIDSRVMAQVAKRKMKKGKLIAELIQVAENEDDDLNNIFIGNVAAANDSKLLQQHNIEAIVTVMDHQDKLIDTKTNHLHIQAFDSLHNEPLISEKYKNQKVFEWIRERSKGSNKKKILIHCFMGQSRSAAIVIAYIMQLRRLTYEQAFTLLQKRRPSIRPNDNFIQQLLKLEKELLADTSRSKIESTVPVSLVNDIQYDTSLEYKTGDLVLLPTTTAASTTTTTARSTTTASSTTTATAPSTTTASSTTTATAPSTTTTTAPSITITTAPSTTTTPTISTVHEMKKDEKKTVSNTASSENKLKVKEKEAHYLSSRDRDQIKKLAIAKKFHRDPKRFHVIDCYGSDSEANECSNSVELNHDGIHCERCHGKIENLKEFLEITDEPFHSSTELPNSYINCQGYKCYQENSYEHTGIWCSTCHSHYIASSYYVDWIIHQHQLGKSSFEISRMAADIPSNDNWTFSYG